MGEGPPFSQAHLRFGLPLGMRCRRRRLGRLRPLQRLHGPRTLALPHHAFADGAPSGPDGLRVLVLGAVLLGVVLRLSHRGAGRLHLRRLVVIWLLLVMRLFCLILLLLLLLVVLLGPLLFLGLHLVVVLLLLLMLLLIREFLLPLLFLLLLLLLLLKFPFAASLLELPAPGMRWRCCQGGGGRCACAKGNGPGGVRADGRRASRGTVGREATWCQGGDRIPISYRSAPMS